MLGHVLKSKAYVKSVIFKCTLEDTMDRFKSIVSDKQNEEEKDIDFEEFTEDTSDVDVEVNTHEEKQEECNFTFRDFTDEELKKKDDIHCNIRFKDNKDSKTNNSSISFNFADIVSDINNDNVKEEKKENTDSKEQDEINDILKDIESSPIFNGVSSMDRIVSATGINHSILGAIEHLTKKVTLEIGFMIDKENIKSILEDIKTIKNTRFYKIKELREVLRDDFTFISSTTNKLLDERCVGMVDIDRSLDDVSIILMKDNKSFISVRSSDDDYTIRFYSYNSEEKKYIIVEEQKVVKFKE